MIFKAYNSKKLIVNYFKIYFFSNLLLIFISLYGLISGAGVLTTLAGIFFLIVVSFLSLNYNFQRNPLSLVLCFYSFLYLCIPTCFILIEGSDYNTGLSVGELPFEQKQYFENRVLGFIYLSVCWFAVWLGIVKSKSFNNFLNKNEKFNISFKSILIVGVFVVIFMFIENQRALSVRGQGIEYTNSVIYTIFAFFLLDHAYLLLAGVLFFKKLNYLSGIENFEKIYYAIILIFLIFLYLNFNAGSKAALLVVSTLLILYPFFLSTLYNTSKVIFFKPLYIGILIFISPILYYFALFKRNYYAVDIDLDLFTIISIVSELQLEVFYQTISSIFYRLCWGGLDQFLLLFDSYILIPFDLQASYEFCSYLVKNTLNLLLPGTPYQEAYAPSSQLFSYVLRKQSLVSEYNSTALFLSLNTQPYTLFGVFMIIFGIYSPFFLYLFINFISFILNYFKNIFISTLILYFFGGILSSYGFEIVIGVTFNVLLSLFFMLYLMKISTHTRFTLLLK
jgi:hypothetical protein